MIKASTLLGNPIWGKTESIAAASTLAALLSFWVLDWAFVAPLSGPDCDIYCGPIKGMVSLFVVMGFAVTTWFVAILMNIIVLLNLRSARLAVWLFGALITLPLVTLLLQGVIIRL